MANQLFLMLILLRPISLSPRKSMRRLIPCVFCKGNPSTKGSCQRQGLLMPHFRTTFVRQTDRRTDATVQNDLCETDRQTYWFAHSFQRGKRGHLEACMVHSQLPLNVVCSNHMWFLIWDFHAWSSWGSVVWDYSFQTRDGFMLPDPSLQCLGYFSLSPMGSMLLASWT